MAPSLRLLLIFAVLVAGLGAPALAAGRDSNDALVGGVGAGALQSDPDLDKKVTAVLFTRRNTGKGEVLSLQDASLLKSSSFSPSVPTKIITHGWLSSETKSGTGGPLLKDALLETGDYNVILVDWSGVDSINYISSRMHVSALGEHVAALIEQLVQVGGLHLADLHLIGHSLGAHIMGFAGRTAGLGDQGRITGLDPAGPLFLNRPSSRLDKSDAGFVDVIHTCGSLLGFESAIGHADFYPNGGNWWQPGCSWDLGACSHCRSYSLLLESIESPGAFMATNCSSWSKFKRNKCKSDQQVELGLRCDTKARGTFYFATNDKVPYSKIAGRAASARLKLTENFTHC